MHIVLPRGAAASAKGNLQDNCSSVKQDKRQSSISRPMDDKNSIKNLLHLQVYGNLW